MGKNDVWLMVDSSLVPGLHIYQPIYVGLSQSMKRESRSQPISIESKMTADLVSPELPRLVGTS